MCSAYNKPGNVRQLLERASEAFRKKTRLRDRRSHGRMIATADHGMEREREREEVLKTTWFTLRGARLRDSSYIISVGKVKFFPGEPRRRSDK